MYIVYLIVFLLACYFPKVAIGIVFVKITLSMFSVALNMQNTKEHGKTVKVENPLSLNEFFIALNVFISAALFFSVFIPVNMLATSVNKYIYFDFGGSIISHLTNMLNQPWSGFYVMLFYLLFTNVRFNLFSLIAQPLYSTTLFVSTLLATIIKLATSTKALSFALIKNDLLILAIFGTYALITVAIKRYSTNPTNLFGESSSLSFANKFFCVSQEKQSGYAPNAEVLWTDSLRLFKRLYFLVFILFFASVTKVTDLDHSYYTKRNQISCVATDAEITKWHQQNPMNLERLGGVKTADSIKSIKAFLQSKCEKGGK